MKECKFWPRLVAGKKALPGHLNDAGQFARLPTIGPRRQLDFQEEVCEQVASDDEVSSRSDQTGREHR